MDKVDLIVDARCLQDTNYARRGIGSHTTTLLAEGLKIAEVQTRFRFVALVDSRMPPLHKAFADLFSSARSQAYRRPSPAAVFLSPSPMTHEPLFTSRLVQCRDVRSIAMVYDFIPFEYQEQYLTKPADRLRYLSNLVWLGSYDAFCAISCITNEQLIRFTHGRAVPSTVTGVAVRDRLQSIGPPPPWPGLRHEIVVAGGNDWRKNVEAALLAHARSKRLRAAGITLRVFGGYVPNRVAMLRALYESAGGEPSALSFAPFLDDAELRRTYAGARLTIVPSRNEGFSMPVVEAAANRCPVLASDCPAHRELLPHPDDRFGCDDIDRLQMLAERVVLDEHTHAAMRARQASLVGHFTTSAVAQRFWGFILGLPSLEAPAIARHQRPLIAMLTPLPPTPSGCADYSAACLPALMRKAKVVLYTDTPNPGVGSGVDIAGVVSPIAYIDRNFDGVVCVLGNSHFHKREFDLLLRHGAAAIAHDARMIDFYEHVLGRTRARATASAELGRQVSDDEIESWLSNPRILPTLFLSEIAMAADPMIVHSPVRTAPVVWTAALAA
jgi:glycosyltransferase involved in cell wall biosynthesis